MNKKLSYIFILFITTLLLLSLFTQDHLLSYSERRNLKTFPDFSMELLLSGEFMEDFEAYALDQFPFRDFFRSLKSYSELLVFNKSDVNDLYLYKDYLFKRTHDYKPSNIDYFTQYILDLSATFPSDVQVYYAIIPDKNYFVPTNTYATINYEKLFNQVTQGLSSLNYIDLTKALDLNDYYKTDTHWKQENLFKVIDQLSKSMTFTTDFQKINYTKNVVEDFKGVYLGQSGLFLPSEPLVYLQSPGTEAASVYNYQYPDNTNVVYETSFIGGMDSYDVYLGGASPLITITNPKASTSKELVIFRDSFASSLAPLLIDEYSLITLVDTRYMSSTILPTFVTFTNQDVLFLYNTEVIINSPMLR